MAETASTPAAASGSRSLLDLSLDEIRKINRSEKRGKGRGGGRGSKSLGGRQGSGIGKRPRGGAGDSARRQARAPAAGVLANKRGDDDDFDIRREPQWKHDKFGADRSPSPRAGNKSGGGGTNVFVQNLAYSVSDADIKELFGSMGRLAKAAVNFDRSGRSEGTADVVFVDRADALRAVAKFNAMILDGRPLQLSLGGGSTSSGGGGGGGVREARSSVAAAPRRTGGDGGGRQGGRGAGGGGRGRGGGRGAGRGAPGGAGRGGGRGRGRGPRQEVSKDQLDKDLEAYFGAGDEGGAGDGENGAAAGDTEQ